jgi:glycosyltransferase involved in cell wall biosynthesis
MVTRTRSPAVVSVLMTAFNRQDFIGAAIESVLGSTLPDFELVIVDDGSSDDTLQIARSYAAADRRVKVHVNAQNLGDYPNRNRAASLASGKYLKYLDSDDLIYPHGLQAMVDCMERFPDAGFGLSQQAEPTRPHPTLLAPRQAYYENFFRRDLFGRAPGSSIIRADAFRAVGGFSGRRQVGDHELWAMLSRAYPMVTMPRDLVWDRTHGAQEQFYDSVGEKLRMHLDVDVEALAHPDCPLTAEERSAALARLSRRHAKMFWRCLLRERAPRKALGLRRAVHLGWPTVLGLPFVGDAPSAPRRFAAATK